MVTRDTILGVLPPFKDQWTLLHPEQSVKDIVHEVLNGHDDFSENYDRIALYFDSDDLNKVCSGLYEFCKRNLEYVEEKEAEQTVASPGALLSRGHCDCKGYSNFCGGVLSALNRGGKKIKWNYRFASYDPMNKSPHHVFIVVHDNDSEIWVDPTPGSEGKQPLWQVDKKINDMALYKISGYDVDEGHAIGITSITVNPFTGDNFNFDGSGHYKNIFSPYLGLDNYRDYSGDRNINEATVASKINSAIQSGPSPGHTVTPDFVKWIYDNSIRSWNFYYPDGVDPNFDANKIIPASFTWTNKDGHIQTITPPKFVVTPDGRVTFDHDAQVDDYRNALIHILTAGAQNLINKYDASPFPLKPADVKNFSQAYTGNPGNPNASLLKEWRGTSVFHDIGKSLEGTVNFLKDEVIKIVGAIPRNAFLAIIGINFFHMATDMQNHINEGKWDSMAKKWKSYGGNPDKLLNTIQHGSKQKETNDQQATVNSADQISGITMGNPAVVAAVIAAATPLIIAFANYFSHSNVHAIAQNGVDQFNAANPNGNYQLVNGQLYSNGKPVSFTGDSDEHLSLKNLAISAAVSALLYFVTNKKGQKKKILIPVLGGIGTYMILQKTTGNQMLPYVPVSSTPSINLPQSQPLLPQILPSIETGITSILNASHEANENSPSGDYYSGDTMPVFQPYSESSV